jgi:hypothetical protein
MKPLLLPCASLLPARLQLQVEENAMSISGNQMALDGLSLIVLSGIGFLLWSFGRLIRESRPGHGPVARLLRRARR